jgi:predicted  nucleic acid-binding Zn-ribbon protein
MKKIILIFSTITALLASSLFVGCESAAKKSSDANETLKDAKTDLNTAEKDAAAAAQKASDAAEWKMFRAESENKISSNETMIGQLKENKKSSGKTLDAVYNRTIEELEQKNIDLKARMEAYDKGQTDWQAFKSEFNRDMDALGKAITDLGKNSKK